MYTCPRRYWWGYYRKIKTKELSEAMQFGADFHAYSDTLLKVSPESAALDVQAASFTEEKKEELIELLGLYADELLPRVKRIEAVEEPFRLQLPQVFPGQHFTEWVTKPDSIAEYEDGLWVNEIKTTSGYGAATAKFYHQSIQTLSYFYVAKKVLPELRGTRLYILVRAKKNPRCEVEDVLLSKEDMLRAEAFILSAKAYAEKLHSEGDFPRFMTKCIVERKGECPYQPICFASGDYLERWVSELFVDSDPEAHLGLSSEEA